MMAVGKVSSSAICNTMSNAREALENLNSSPTHPDVIFLDLNMPIMTGQEFLIKIKQCQNLARIPVIIFSTSSNQTTKDLTKNLGAESFITKPQLLEDLIAILQPIIN